MPVFTRTAAAVFDPVDASGNARGADMAEAQVWAVEVERLINALSTGATLLYQSKASLDADLDHASNTAAVVIGDATESNNGLYVKTGASGSGAWVRVGDVPGYSFILAQNSGAGTANAIVATTPTGLPSADGGALIALPILATTTASPQTVAFDGGSELTIKTNSGANVATGGLTAGMVVAGYKVGSTFRLLSDIASSAIQAAAEAAQAGAEAAQAAAEAAAGTASGIVPVADYTALAALDHTAVKAAFVYGAGGRNGFFRWQGTNLSTFVTNDPQKGIYVAPSSGTTGSSGAWVRQLENLQYNVLWFGAVGDGTTDDHTAIQAAINLSSTIGQSVRIPSAGYAFAVTTALSVSSRLELFGDGYHGDEGKIYETSTTVPTTRCSVLICGSGNNAININTAESVYFHDFQISYPSGATSGVTALYGRVPSTHGNTYSRFERLLINGPHVGLDLQDYYDVIVSGNVITNVGNVSIAYRNTIFPSYSDSIISGNSLLSGTATYHLYIQNGGGIRIENNKINYGNNVNSVGIYFALWNYTVSGTPTAYQLEPVVITGNSIEGQIQGIVFQRQSSSLGSVSLVTITGNEVWVGSSALDILADGTNQYINGFSISGNAFSANVDSAQVVSIDAAQNGTICGNFIGGGASVSGVSPLVFGSHCTNVKHSGNVYGGNAPFSIATPSVPATTVVYTQPYHCPADVNISSGSISAIAINGTTVFSQTAGNGFYSTVLNPGDTIALTYTSTASWLWRPVNP